MESSVVDYVPDIQHVQAGMGSSVVNTSITLLNTISMSIPDIRNSTANFNTSRVM
jgi:hypothetical protein